MPRPGFYNDNEYRAYPFVYVLNYTGPAVPDATIVDAGFIVGLNSGFEPGTHSIWLSSIARASGVYTFTFSSDAPGLTGKSLVFERAEDAAPWMIEHASSAAETAPEDCDVAPAWEGFLVTGPLDALAASLQAEQTRTLSANDRVIEPARVQSLVRNYVRSINLGNFNRVMATFPTTGPYAECGDSIGSESEYVVVNARCLQGELKVREGYNCRIRQVARTNELRITAEKNAGAPPDAEQCLHGGEIPLYPDEPVPEGSKFFSGGPACDELISTINGIGGANVNIIGGTGVTVTTDPATNTIRVTLASNNLTGNCASGGGA